VRIRIKILFDCWTHQAGGSRTTKSIIVQYKPLNKNIWLLQQFTHFTTLTFTTFISVRLRKTQQCDHVRCFFLAHRKFKNKNSTHLRTTCNYYQLFKKRIQPLGLFWIFNAHNLTLNIPFLLRGFLFCFWVSGKQSWN
jgi:hypothetical protein